MRLARSHALLLALAALAPSGCSSDPPAPVYTFPTEVVKRERISPDPPPPATSLVDVDGLRKVLERSIPKGWTIEDPEDQLESPPGWERLEGDRGLSVRIVDHRRSGGFSADPYFVLYLFPRGWRGRDVVQGLSIEEDKLSKLPRARTDLVATEDPVAFYGSSQEWLFFHSTKGQAPSATTVHAGWSQPEEDIARALGVARSR